VVTLACWRARFARRADAFAPPLARWADLEVHTAHATHAATTVVVGRGFLLRQLGDHGFGGDHQAGDRGGVLQGRTGHLGRVEDTHGDHVAEFAGGGVGTVRQSADSAQQASRLSAETQVIADRGRVAVDEVGSTMRVIQESSQRISEITQVIDSIAFQTNILALNAAVEAARAGEQGRGFAVVAAEVRALAQRSAGAAKEIKQLIDDSVSKVETGHEKTEVARKTMGEVVDSVRRVNALVDEISHAAREQLSGISQVNDAVMQLDTITQQNAALVEQIAASARSLEGVAHNTTETVQVFRIDSGASSITDAVALRRQFKEPKPML